MRPDAPNEVKQGARNVGIETIVMSIAEPGDLGRPVIDRTGLVGKYDWVLEYSPQPTNANPVADPAGPSLLEALREQLGLKLVPAKEPVTSLIIAHVQRPTDN